MRIVSQGLVENEATEVCTSEAFLEVLSLKPVNEFTGRFINFTNLHLKLFIISSKFSYQQVEFVLPETPSSHAKQIR